MNEHIKNTIVFPTKDDMVLLGMKKRGFGAGWWNGFGGKLKTGESYEAGARRETFEEVGLTIQSLKMVAKLLFYFEGNFEIACKAFVSTDFTGAPVETEEMRPQWFSLSALPFDLMWPADRHWVPLALEISPTDEPVELAIYFKDGNNFERLTKPDAKILAEVFKA